MNPQLTLSAHRIDGVIDEVCPHLVQFAAEGIYEKRNLLIVALHFYAVF